MRFLSIFHRSMVDPAWHKEPQAASLRFALFYYIKIIALVGVCAGIAHTGYALSEKKGLARQLAAVLPDASIRDGRLVPATAVPAMVNTARLSSALSMLFMINSFEALPDSFLIVDTSGTVQGGDRSTIRLLLAANKLIVNPGSRYTMVVPYTRFIPATGTLRFKQSQLQTIVKRHRIDLLIHFIVLGLIINFFSLSGTVFFLAVTGFILSMRAGIGFGRYVTVAIYSIAPAVAGTIIVAASGTSFYWMGQLQLVASTIVMYRAVMAIARPVQPSQTMLK